jgi:hypothetical protein
VRAALEEFEREMSEGRGEEALARIKEQVRRDEERSASPPPS